MFVINICIIITKSFKKVKMSTIASQFGMPEALKALGIKEINDGTSTGSNCFSSGEIIESYSPVDGQLIGKVKATTQEDYEKVKKHADIHFIGFMKAKESGNVLITKNGNADVPFRLQSKVKQKLI